MGTDDAGIDVTPSVLPAISHTTTQSMTMIAHCCIEKGVSDQCLAGCTDDASLSSINNLDSECAVDLPKMLHCVSGLYVC